MTITQITTYNRMFLRRMMNDPLNIVSMGGLDCQRLDINYITCIGLTLIPMHITEIQISKD